jgi:hypothetical protein
VVLFEGDHRSWHLALTPYFLWWFIAGDTLPIRCVGSGVSCGFNVVAAVAMMLVEEKVRIMTVVMVVSQVVWGDGQRGSFHGLWLRDNCPHYFDQNTGHTNAPIIPHISDNHTPFQ